MCLSQDVAQVLAEEYPQRIDIAYEGVGGPLRDAVVDNLAPGGRLLAVGYISGYPHTQTSNPQSEPGTLAVDQDDDAPSLPVTLQVFAEDESEPCKRASRAQAEHSRL